MSVRRKAGRVVAVATCALVVVTPFSAASGSAGAAAFPLGWSGGHQTAELTGPGLPDAQFGSSVALNGKGTEAVVGVPNVDQGRGAVYVYAKSHGSWSQAAELTATDGENYDGFGYSVAMSASGKTVAVGAIGAPLGGSAGAAYIFAVHGGSWSQVGEVTDPQGVDGDVFGWSVGVSRSGASVIVGAMGAGRAYIYTEDAGSWTQAAQLSGSGYFGWSVALSPDGSTAMVGAIEAQGGEGAVYVFGQSGGAWTQSAEVTPGDGGQDQLGYWVSASADGSEFAAGAPGAQGSVGAVDVYQESGGSWPQSASLAAQGGAPDDLFGATCSMSAKGNAVVVGASNYLSGIGSAYVFTQGASGWRQATMLTASDGAPGDDFGYAVAVSGNGKTALSGSVNYDSEAGAAYVFKR